MAFVLVLTLSMFFSVLARVDEHFAQGAFCPGPAIATTVPVLPQGFANDHFRQPIQKQSDRGNDWESMRHGQLLPCGGRFCRVGRHNLPTFRMVKAARE
jgi:hypothetical protein